MKEIILASLSERHHVADGRVPGPVTFRLLRRPQTDSSLLHLYRDGRCKHNRLVVSTFGIGPLRLDLKRYQ